jgi:hypothetical protein
VFFFSKIAKKHKNTNTYTQNHADVCPFLDDGVVIVAHDAD